MYLPLETLRRSDGALPRGKSSLSAALAELEATRDQVLHEARHRELTD